MNKPIPAETHNITRVMKVRAAVIAMVLLVIYGSAATALYISTMTTKDHQIASLNTSLSASSVKLNKSQSQVSSLNTQLTEQAVSSKVLEDQIASLQAKLNTYESAPKGPNLVLSVADEHSADTVTDATIPTTEHHVFVDITITNTGDTLGSLTFNDIQGNIKLVSSDGNSYFTELGSIVPQTEGDNLITPQSITPGTSAKGSLYFVLDKSITSGTLYFGAQAIPVTIH